MDSDAGRVKAEEMREFDSCIANARGCIERACLYSQRADQDAVRFALAEAMVESVAAFGEAVRVQVSLAAAQEPGA